jgi:hypothetical protein
MRNMVLASLAAAAVLVISCAAVIPGPWHDGMPGHTCEVCRSGHLPILAPLARADLQGPLAVEWRAQPPRVRAFQEPLLHGGFPRPPPA